MARRLNIRIVDCCMTCLHAERIPDLVCKLSSPEPLFYGINRDGSIKYGVESPEHKKWIMNHLMAPQQICDSFQRMPPEEKENN